MTDEAQSDLEPPTPEETERDLPGYDYPANPTGGDVMTNATETQSKKRGGA